MTGSEERGRTLKTALGILVVCVLALGGLLAWQLWPSAEHADARVATARACEAAVRVQNHPQGLYTYPGGGGYTYPASYQVGKVVAAFHGDGVSAELVRLADRLDQADRGANKNDVNVRLAQLVAGCE